MSGSQQVFVYGTLRRHASHHHLLARAHFLGHHVTPIGYTMYDLGAYPAVVARGSHRIHGEVYRLSQRMLAILDDYEAYPDDYHRRRIVTPFGPSWIYLWRRQAIVSGYTAPAVKSGDWLVHESGGYPA